MTFEMPTSRTADAAKLAVLWRDKGGAGGGGGLDRILFEMLFGAFVEIGDGTNLANRETVFKQGTSPLSLYTAIFGGATGVQIIDALKYGAQNGSGLTSIYGMISDIRSILVPTEPGSPGGVQTTEPLKNGTDQEVLIGGSFYSTIVAMQGIIEEQQQAIEELSDRVRELAAER
ncbi:hypothetical protein Sa4125_29740 [Aureimonas sp. SA4125]|uniref:hypothetical protein n=1 Tax=Aureimonas sp. SA4125 TaxID=2826993 RepID=UPI001CC350F4|nr:hypothetical protein [Aureimonas sp. SA4125]BDA85432.1 hypothetical protein Sa4125_29740 [Aureimonas sp. SA4125]